MKNFFKKYKWYVLLFLFVVTTLVWYAVFAENKNVLTVSFLDVGQGDAVFVDSPNGNQVLIDGGSPNGKVLRELRKVMPFYDRSIDVVIATHPDQDHIGGLVDVLERYKVGLIIESGAESTSNAYQEKEKILKEKEIKTILGRRGTTLDLGGGARLGILYPDKDVIGLESNEASIVARLVYGDNEFLFMGDAPKNVENHIIVLDDEEVESDVLKAGHHGSNTSTGPMILATSKPKFVIISAEKNNSYGHPHEEVIDLLNDFGAIILETSTLGTITFVSDGRDLKIK